MSNFSEHEQRIDWRDMIRLALIVSVFAAAAAAALVGQVSETTIVVSVIVVATVASWFHMDHAAVRHR